MAKSLIHNVPTVGDILDGIDKEREMSAVAKIEESQGSSVLEVIARAVRDPATDVDKMERLFALQKEFLAEQAKVAFNVSFRAAKSEMRPVVRNRHNEQTKSNYANLEAVSEALDPIIDRHGFGLTFGTGTSDKEDHYRIVCDVLHDGGHERNYFADIPADIAGIKGTQNKTLTHGFGSTMSYGRRYLKLMIFDIATKDDDGNSAGSRELITADQCAELRRLIASSGATEEAFCDYARCGTLPELLAKDFERARRILQQKGSRNGDN